MMKFTAPDRVTDEQVAAFSTFFARETGWYVPAVLARGAMEAAREVLASGLGPVFAVNAACAVVYPGTDRPDLRQPRMVRTLNAMLSAEDASGQLLHRPGGLLPLGIGALPKGK